MPKAPSARPDGRNDCRAMRCVNKDHEAASGVTPRPTTHQGKKLRVSPRDAASTEASSERTYSDIRRWTVMSRGGHFAAMEQPKALVAEIRELFRTLRA